MNTTSTTPFSLHTLTSALPTIWSLAQSFGYGIACWSTPLNNKWTIILDRQPKSLKKEIFKLTDLPCGYISAPFKETADGIYAYFLEATNIIHYNETGQLESIQLENEIEQKIQTHIYSSIPTKVSFVPNNTTSEEYKQSIEAVVKEIQKGELQKVVIARHQEIPFNVVNIGEQISLLRKEYPHAFISFFYHPITETWLTATPEILLKQDNHGIFKTMALAGTQALKAGDISSVSWTEKEIEEQALVSRYIINCFKMIRLREYEEIGPRTMRAGNLVHLRTEYIIDTNEVNYPDLADTMMRLLHPTSAVCGMPKEKAVSIIDSFEKQNRELYSGFIGPVNENGTTTLFVNIRCAKIELHKATLYSGAGITADSNPDKEWNETEIKLDTIRAFFHE
jgi:isochorismate synthase